MKDYVCKTCGPGVHPFKHGDGSLECDSCGSREVKLVDSCQELEQRVAALERIVEEQGDQLTVLWELVDSLHNR